MRRYLARILEGLPCGVLVADRRGELRMMNPEARVCSQAAASGPVSLASAYSNCAAGSVAAVDRGIALWLRTNRAGIDG